MLIKIDDIYNDYTHKFTNWLQIYKSIRVLLTDRITVLFYTFVDSYLIRPPAVEAGSFASVKARS
jgi:hypothetical protein